MQNIQDAQFCQVRTITIITSGRLLTVSSAAPRVRLWNESMMHLEHRTQVRVSVRP